MVQENSLGGKAPIDDEECFIVDGHNQYTNVSYIQQQQQHQLQHQPLLHHSSSVAGSTTSIVNNSSSISNGGYGNNYSKIYPVLTTSILTPKFLNYCICCHLKQNHHQQQQLHLGRQ